MPYQNVGRPRFYINILEWLETTGYFSSINAAIKSHFRTLPVDPQAYGGAYAYDVPVLGTQNFIAILGHQFKTDNSNYSLSDWTSYGTVVNSTPASGFDGFSISTFPDQITHIKPQFTPTVGLIVGSVVIGTYYDMPHSPDLSLTMSREYGGVKTIETKGGATLSNSNWLKPPAWGAAPAWELYDGEIAYPELSRSGRRTWDLSFSYLDDGDVFGSNQFINQSVWGTQTAPPYETDEINTSNNFAYNIQSDPNFYAQVIHRTNGGQLPFIFQPDRTDNTNFAICKFDMNSFKFDQVANGVYNVKLKIREVW